MRLEACIYCGEQFAIKPNHPAWEIDVMCRSCYRIVAPTWNMAYVLPAEIGRATRAENV